LFRGCLFAVFDPFAIAGSAGCAYFCLPSSRDSSAGLSSATIAGPNADSHRCNSAVSRAARTKTMLASLSADIGVSGGDGLAWPPDRLSEHQPGV